MLGLEVLVFCLLFGALAESQTTQCTSEFRHNIVADDFKSFRKHFARVSSLQGGVTVASMYTSLSTLLRPSHCRSHPREPSWKASRFLVHPAFRDFEISTGNALWSSALNKCLPKSSLLCLLYLPVVGIHQSVCSAIE